jgi:hypothetical protein
MSRRNPINRYPQQPEDWGKVSLKHQRPVDAEEARARAKILEEIAAIKREREQLQLNFRERVEQS